MRAYDELVSYIGLSAPATRRPAAGDEPFLRPEFGFTPKWYHDAVGVDFGERWHRDPEYRRGALAAMAQEVRRRFPGVPIGQVEDPAQPTDLLTGVYGASFVALLYGIPIEYQHDNWPWSARRHLDGPEVDRLEPPDLDRSPAFTELLEQVEWIERETGTARGYVNWQGVLNSAYRIRGEDLFLEMVREPARVHHLLSCVAATMIEGARRLYARQRAAGVDNRHFTVSNCLVNMVSPRHYEEYLLPHDRRIAEEFGLIGIHNCAWNANPYLEHYASIPDVAYVDMGMESDLDKARALFPAGRRALMYTPMDVRDKSNAELRADLQQIADRYGPCDLVFADIESGTPDLRILELARTCAEISAEKVSPRSIPQGGSGEDD